MFHQAAQDGVYRIALVYWHRSLPHLVFPRLWWIISLSKQQSVSGSKEKWVIEYSGRSWLSLIFSLLWSDGAPSPRGPFRRISCSYVAVISHSYRTVWHAMLNTCESNTHEHSNTSQLSRISLWILCSNIRDHWIITLYRMSTCKNGIYGV